MAVNNFYNAKHTTENQINENHDLFTNEQTCVICKGTVKNACNGLCGCKYCWECIEIYLNGEEKCCPGEFDECRKQLLYIDENILVDQSTESKISRIVVKCNKQSNESIDEFHNIKEDLIQYETGSVKCPFSNLGCCESKMIKDEINEHLDVENYSHTKLLMKWIDNLRNEIRIIKSAISSSRKENNELKKEIHHIKKDAEEKQAIISQLIINDHYKSLQIKHLMSQLNLNEVEYRNPESEYNGANLLVDYDPSSQLEDITEMAIETDILTMRPDIYKTIQIINKKIDNFDKKITQLRLIQEKQNYGEFVWTIDQFSDKIKKAREATNQEIYSESFYSHRNGYKMCLRVDPSGINTGKGSYLAVHFCIIQGPFDDILQWPMKHSVTFSLINQQSGLIHTSRTVRFDDVVDNIAWKKPTDDKRIAFGSHKFISMDELLSNDELCRNDQIFIICSVDTSL